MIIFNVGDLTVEKLETSDVNYFFILLGKKEIQEFIPDRFETTEAMLEAITWLISNYEEKEPIRLSYKICLEKKLIGCVSYGPLPYDKNKKELSYFNDPEYWGRGYMTKTVREFIKWLKNNHINDELYTEIEITNIGSRKVAERNKFQEVLEFDDKDTNKRKKLYVKR